MGKNLFPIIATCFLAGFLVALPFAKQKRGPRTSPSAFNVPSPSELMRSVKLVEEETVGMPAQGMALLRELFGWRETLALRSALGGRYVALDRPCRYARDEVKTRIWLPALTGSEGSSHRAIADSVSVWTVDIDNRSGEVLRTPDLQDLPKQDLLNIALPAHQTNSAVARLTGNAHLLSSLLGEPKSLLGTNCYDVHGQRIGDRMKFYWRGVFSNNPNPDELNLLRFVYWIDIKSRAVVDSTVEVSGLNIDMSL